MNFPKCKLSGAENEERQRFLGERNLWEKGDEVVKRPMCNIYFEGSVY
jgi:hypothetical protein